MTRRKKLVAGAGMMIVLFGAVILRGLSTDSHDKGNTPTRPVPVEITPVVRSPLAESITAIGTVNALHDVVVSSETGGRITGVAFAVGDVVRKGQTLVQVDDELQAIAVEQARAQTIAAQTSFAKAKKDFERGESLYGTKDISDSELETYRLGYRSAEAQYRSAVASLKQAERAYTDTKIKATISGIIASKKVEIGEMVMPGKEVVNIVDLGSLKVRLSIPEKEITRVRPHQVASLTVDSAPGMTFQGSVFSVGSKAESPTGHTYPVEIMVKNSADLMLKAGMFARVDIRTNAVSDALVISKESIVNDDTQPSVFVAEDRIARLRSITTGIRSGDSVQVLRGLHEGELVVSFGQKSLKNGTPVVYTQ
jgi:RND family efflux transporter MFP subunit